MPLVLVRIQRTAVEREVLLLALPAESTGGLGFRSNILKAASEDLHRQSLLTARRS